MDLAEVPDSAVIAPVADVDPAGDSTDDDDFKGRLRALSQRNEG
jgi:hypothetical protein